MSHDDYKPPPRPLPPKDYLQLSTYEFKCNIAHYLRLLQKDGHIKRLVINQYKKPIAMVVPLIHPKKDEG